MKNRRMCLIIIASWVWVYGLNGCQALGTPNALSSAIVEQTKQPSPFGPENPSIIKAHRDEVLAITWFKLPYSGEFYWLRLTMNNQIDFWRVLVNFANQGQGHTQLNDDEVQEVKTLLAKLANGSPTHPKDSMTISVSFPLNDEIQFMTFGENCPNDLRRIFELVEAAFAGDGIVAKKWLPCSN